MTGQLTLHDNTVGSCIVCGGDSKGSNYWVAMTDEQWAVVRPLVAHLFPSKDHIHKSAMFIPSLDKPLCGPQCSNKWHQQRNSGED